MTRAILLALMLFVAALWVGAAAQDPAPSDKVDADDKAVEKRNSEPGNEKVGRTLADYVQDSSTEPVEMTVSGIEKVLKETGGVTVRFSKHQVTMPVASDVAPAKVAERILSHAKSVPGLQMHAGKTALLISTESNLGSAMVLSLAKVMFIEPGTRAGVTNPPTDSKFLERDGLPATPLEPGDLLKKGVLDRTEDITLMLGTYNIIFPLSDESPRRALAAAIVRLVEEDSSIRLWDARKPLLVMTPLERLEPLLTSFIGILNVTGNPAKGADANTKAGGGLSISVPALGPEPIGVNFGGGGLGGFAPPLPAQAMPSKNYVMGKNIVIALSEKGDHAWGYSKKLGKWTTLKLDSSAEKAFPVLGDEVACVINAATPSDTDKIRFVWGYSPITGGWDKLTLPAGSKAQPVIQTDMIFVEDGDYVQIFSAQSGKWSAPPKPDDGVVLDPGTPIGLPGPPNLNTPLVPADKPEIKIFTLAHIQAEDAATLVRQLFRHLQLSVAPDARTNSLLAQGPSDVLMQIEAVLIRLDETKTANDKRADPLVPNLKDVEQASGRITQLKGQYAVQEQKAAAIAQQIRNVAQPTEQAKTNLRQAVADAFSLRQHLHQAEVAAFQQRMTKVQQIIRTRDQLKDQIINRRVEDLLNPNLNWNSTPDTQKLAPQFSGPTEIDGEWQLESIKGSGVIAFEQDLKVRVQNHHWIVLRGESESRYRLVIDSASNPKSIDIVMEWPDGRPPLTSRGIYRLDGNSVITAWGPNPDTRPAGFDGSHVHTYKRISPSTATVQVRLVSPEGATIAGLDQDAFIFHGGLPTPIVPLRLRLTAGKSNSLQMSEIPSHPGFVQSLTVEVPTLTKASQGFLSLNAIPLAVTDEDLNQTIAGNPVVKVLYLRNAEAGEVGPSTVEVIVNTRLDPANDPVAEAEKRGTVLAVVRMSQAQLPANAAPSKTEVRGEDPLEGQGNSGLVGVVKEVQSKNERLLISGLDSKLVSKRDVLYVLRKDSVVDGIPHYHWLATLEVIKFESKGDIQVRVTRSKKDEEVKVGDEVRWPKYNLQINPLAATDTLNLPPNNGPTTWKDVEDFQERFIKLEHTLDLHCQQLREARAALAAGTGKQASIDACQIQVDAWGKRLAAVRAELEAQIKILDLGVQSAKNVSDIAALELSKAVQSNQLFPGTVTDLEIKRLEHNKVSTGLKMEQAKVLLELYQGVARKPASSPNAATDFSQPSDATAFLWQQLGLRVQAVDTKTRSMLPRFYGGLQVLEVRANSPASLANILNGDILVGLASWETLTPAHAVFAIRNNLRWDKSNNNQAIRFYLVRGDKTLFGQLTHPVLLDDPTAKTLSPDTPRHITHEFRFESVAWLEFLEWLGRSTDRGLIIGTLPTGTFSHSTTEPLRLDEILEVVNASLASQGLEVTAADTSLRVAKKGDSVMPDASRQTKD